MARQCSVSGFGAMCFFVGLGLGAVAGIMLAPQSGEETRKKIHHHVERGRDYVTNQQEVVRRRAQELMAEGRRRAEGVRDKAKDWANRAGFTQATEN